MKFRKSGQILLALLVTAGLWLGVTSCTYDYTVAYVYVTGSQYNQIGAFKEDNDTGALTPASGSPFSSGGTNPVRSLVYNGGRYLYVLNEGSPSAPDATGNISYSGANISLFSIGGNGFLAFQVAYFSQGSGSIRLHPDASGKYLYVLDQFAPITDATGTIRTSSSTQSANFPCYDASTGLYRSVGDVTAFNVDPATGRLSVILNQQQVGTNGKQLTYFPVGCFPEDFTAAPGFIYAAQAGTAATGDVQSIYVYGINSTTGQLTLTQNTPLQTGAGKISQIQPSANSKYIYVLDSLKNQIIPFTIGSNGALQAISGGAAQNDSVALDPIAMMTDSQGKFLYVANAAGASGINAEASYITAFTINPTSGVLQEIAGSPFGTGSGPQCILEDPSKQYVYTADFNTSTVTGHLLDPNSGVLTDLRKGSTFTTVGNPTWCVISGTTF